MAIIKKRANTALTYVFLLPSLASGLLSSSIRKTRLCQFPHKPVMCLSSLLSCSSPYSQASPTSPFETLCDISVIDPRDGSTCSAVDSSLFRQKNVGMAPLNTDDQQLALALVVVMPQLGDFDSFEYAEQLRAVLQDLSSSPCSMSLRVIGIGDIGSARRFCDFTGLPLECLRIDPLATVHRALVLHRGPNWDVPGFIPDMLLLIFSRVVGATTSARDSDDDIDTARNVFRAWLNYMAMCAGIAAPGTLSEILRGYLGDKSAPERLRWNETVSTGPISITGTRVVKIGPIEYENSWKDEVGYQRPVELATVRLRSMVEVLSNLAEYVPDQRYIDWRGATFIFDPDGQALYEYRDRGVLTYSETMDRPLSFLGPYIGDNRARNPLGLGDPEMEESIS